MAFDEGKLARGALDSAANELYQALMLIAKSHPEIIRRGVKAMFEQPLTSSQRTQTRKQVQELGASDPGELESVLSGMVKQTSFAEVADLLAKGRGRE